MSNTLVAGPVNTATPFSGAGLLDSGSQLVAAIESGNWVEGGLAAFGAAADTVAAVIDPLGSLLAAGLGWLIDHFEPIKGWFNDLTGDAGAVIGFSQTWANVQTQLEASAGFLDRVVTDLDDMAGEAIDAYRRFQADAAAHIRASGQWAGAMSTGLQIASTIVQVVHDLVRDILSQLVGSAISWATQAVVTVGIATPWIVAQVSSRVASWTAKISSKLTGLLRSCGKLGDLLNELRALMNQGVEKFSDVLGKGSSPQPHASAPRTPRPKWGDENGKVDIRSVLDTETPEPPVGPVNPSDVVFDIPRDGHVFWSGRTDIATEAGTGTYGSSGIAAGLARQHEATTLEMYLADNGIAMPKWGEPGAEEAWGEISRRYADAASGEVHVVLGSSMRPGNIWETRELGALQSNPDVTRIVAIDPSTGATRTIFER